MITLNKLVEYLNGYLNIEFFKDYSFNGLQFEGRLNIKKVAFAVDAGVSVFQKATEEKADILIVHHGLFWKYNNPSFTGMMKERTEILFNNSISLYAVHLPLDTHKIIGNNVELLNIVGAKKLKSYAKDGAFCSYYGSFEKSKSLDKIVTILCKKLNTECKVLPFGKKSINKIAVMSGSGSRSHLDEAISLGADLFITGEEMDIYQTALDSKINVIFAGHNASETTGPKALQKHLEKKFKIKTVFIDMPTDL